MVYIWAWAGPRVCAAKVDLLEDGASGREVEAHTAVFLRYQGTEVAGLGHRRDELFGVAAFCVEVAPVLVRESGAYLPYAPAEILVLFRQDQGSHEAGTG